MLRDAMLTVYLGKNRYGLYHHQCCMYLHRTPDAVACVGCCAPGQFNLGGKGLSEGVIVRGIDNGAGCPCIRHGAQGRIV